MDTKRSTHEGLRELALFAGAGGGILGGHLLGWRTVCAVEINPYAASVLCARQNDGILPPFPVWDDVCTFDGRPWRGRCDVISGGFPCQDISIAGKGRGLEGERSGLWREMARIIGEVRPRYVLVENSPMLVTRGLGTVLGDLSEMGYDAQWGVIGANDAGAPHKRDRIWIVANANTHECAPRREQRSGRSEQGKAAFAKGGDDVADAQIIPERKQADENIALSSQREARIEPVRGREQNGGDDVVNANSQRREEQHASSVTSGKGFARGRRDETADTADERDVRRIGSMGNAESRSGYAGGGAEDGGGEWWAVEPDVGRVVDGISARVERLEALGNAQVPRVVEIAWKMLGGGMI